MSHDRDSLRTIAGAELLQDVLHIGKENTSSGRLYILQYRTGGESFMFLSSTGYLDGKLIRAGQGMACSLASETCRHSDVGLKNSMADQELNAARLDAGIERGAWQTSGAAR